MDHAPMRRLTLFRRAVSALVACALLALTPYAALAQRPTLSPPTPQSFGLTPTNADNAGEITIAVETDRPQIVLADTGESAILMDGYDYVSVSGAPRLPVRHLEVRLPAGARLGGVALEDAVYQPMPGTYDIARVAPEAESEGGMQAPIAFEPPPSQVFPETPVEVSAVHTRGGAQIVTVRLYSVQYNLADKTLTWIRSGRIVVRYRRLGGPTARPGLAQAAGLDAPQPQGDSLAPGYAIAVRSDLAQSASVLNFKRHKESEGFAVHIITPENWAGYAGKDSADRLRALLQDKWREWNLQYLLLVGSAASIPTKTMYPSNTDHASTWATPSDMYYADLTGDWDRDRDGFPGEFRDDAVDFGAELLVGRIPYDSEALISTVLERTIAYETTDGPWRKRALLAMAILDYDSSGRPQTDGAYLGESMRGYLTGAGFGVWRLYEEHGGATQLPHDGALDRDSLAANWGNGYGFVSWWGHGSPTGAYRTLWSGSQATKTPFADIYHLNALATQTPPIVFQNACSNGVPQTYSLAAQVLRYGAIATVAPTATIWYRTGWRSPADGGSGTLAYYFGDELVTKGRSVGEALARARELHSARYLSSPGQQQTALAFALYGDPSLQMTPRPRQQTVQIAVREGWNLLAMPAAAQPLSVPDALASIDGIWAEVHAYDPTDAATPWKVYRAGTPAEANSLRQLNPLQGFWLLANADATLTIPAGAPTMASGHSVELYPGWNLVGFPGGAPMAADDALRDIAPMVESVFTLDSSGGAWLTYSPAAQADANTLQALEPGRGYWIYATAPTLWQVP